MKHLFSVWEAPQPVSLGHARRIVREHAHDNLGAQPRLDAYARWLSATFPVRGKEDDVLTDGAPPAPFAQRVLRFRVNLFPEGALAPNYERETRCYRMLVTQALEAGLHVMVSQYTPTEQVVNGILRDTLPPEQLPEPEDPGSMYRLPSMRCPPAFFWDYVPEQHRQGPLPDPVEVQRVLLTRLATALAPHGFRAASPRAPASGPVLARMREGTRQELSVACVLNERYHGVEASLAFGRSRPGMPASAGETPVVLSVPNHELLGFDSTVCIRDGADLKSAREWFTALALGDLLAALDGPPRP